MVTRVLLFLEKYLKIDTRYVFSGGSWLLIAHVVSVLTILISSYFFANYLSPEAYGQYKYILTLGVTLTAFSFTGAGVAITQAAARGISGFFTYMRRINFYYSLILSCIAAVGAAYYFIQGNQELALGLIIIAILQPLFNNSGLIFPYLYGTQQFKISTFGQAAKAIVTTSVMVVTILLTNNIFVLLLCYFISNIVVNFLLQFAFAPKHEILTEKSVATSLFKYGKHASVQNVISGVSNHADKLLIFQNLGAAELAIYAFATALPDQYKALTNSIETMLLPRFTKQSEASIKSTIVRKSIIYFFLLLALLLAYVAVAPFVYALLYPQYESSLFLSQLYAVGMLFGIGGLPLTALRARLSNKKLYQFNVSISIFQITSLVILIPLFGLLGAVFARVFYRGFVCFTAFVLFFRK